MKPSCILLCIHHCTECYSVTAHTRCETVVHNNLLSWFAQEVTPLSRILYCQDSHMSWNRCVECCIVPTHTRCKFIMHLIILSRHTLNMEPLYIKLYCHDSLATLKLCGEHCTVTNHIPCETFWNNIILSRHPQNVQTVVQNIALSWFAHNVKPLGNRLMGWPN